LIEILPETCRYDDCLLSFTYFDLDLFVQRMTEKLKIPRWYKRYRKPILKDKHVTTNITNSPPPLPRQTI